MGGVPCTQSSNDGIIFCRTITNNNGCIKKLSSVALFIYHSSMYASATVKRHLEHRDAGPLTTFQRRTSAHAAKYIIVMSGVHQQITIQLLGHTVLVLIYVSTRFLMSWHGTPRDRSRARFSI